MRTSPAAHFSPTARSLLPAGEIPASVTLHLPYGSQRHRDRATNPTLDYPGGPAAILFALLPTHYRRTAVPPTACRYSPASSPRTRSPTPTTTRCKRRSEKRFTHGLQFQMAYTFSKSIDNASSFEEHSETDLRPLQSCAFAVRRQAPFRDQLLWELPVPQYQGAKGKIPQWLGGFGHHQFPERLPDPYQIPSRQRIGEQLRLRAAW